MWIFLILIVMNLSKWFRQLKRTERPRNETYYWTQNVGLSLLLLYSIYRTLFIDDIFIQNSLPTNCASYILKRLSQNDRLELLMYPETCDWCLDSDRYLLSVASVASDYALFFVAFGLVSMDHVRLKYRAASLILFGVLFVEVLFLVQGRPLYQWGYVFYFADRTLFTWIRHGLFGTIALASLLFPDKSGLSVGESYQQILSQLQASHAIQRGALYAQSAVSHDQTLLQHYSEYYKQRNINKQRLERELGDVLDNEPPDYYQQFRNNIRQCGF
ncbi:hypothetical protein EDD86DRAFT_276635 [Gorgonomyces haynaldii]|nr:hypothetical protein EDD86DRAFT_276635 [Gorgonomyces haynaldii]